MIKIDREQESEYTEALAQLHALLADAQKYHARTSGKLMMIEERIEKAQGRPEPSKK
jgi:hypothetical protein